MKARFILRFGSGPDRAKPPTQDEGDLQTPGLGSRGVTRGVIVINVEPDGSRERSKTTRPPTLTRVAPSGSLGNFSLPSWTGWINREQEELAQPAGSRLSQAVKGSVDMTVGIHGDTRRKLELAVARAERLPGADVGAIAVEQRCRVRACPGPRYLLPTRGG